MFGHDDHDDDKKEEAVTVDPVTAIVDDNSTVHDDANNVPAQTDISDLSSATTPPVEEVSADKPATSPADQSLLDLKKQALEELSPLVEHLDQTPEEKFKTTMMLIQATDSSNLISTAHEAAKAITDEKVRAQALLDIVNEINYFTQK